MNKHVKLTAVVLLLAALLTGCGKDTEKNASAANNSSESVETTAATEETVPETIPADGNPDDVTCQGSYTSESVDGDAVVASMGEISLTNEELQAWYWMEVNRYLLAENEISPDFSRPLDTQACEIEDSVNSWQQYFLKRALNTWHTSQALTLQGQDEGVPTEEAYQPNKKNHEIYLTDKPATKVLYGYNESYLPNELHQAYLDNIPTMLEEMASELGYASTSAMAEAIGVGEAALTAYTETYNRGYMYFTELRYHIAPAAEEVEAWFAENEASYKEAGITKTGGHYVDMRHILLLPEGDSAEDWENCEIAAHAMLEEFLAQKDHSEPRFAELANAQSADEGSALNGGLYSSLKEGQLCQALNDWCFDSARQVGDFGVVRSEEGVHIVYLSSIEEIWYAEAEADLAEKLASEIVSTAREKYPMETVDYSAMALTQAQDIPGVDLLYPDVAHERYPVVQLYLQQDYPTTKYGPYNITSYGCGITTMAMLATYMTDTELTPPMMCERYPNYVFSNGTDGSLFNNTPAEMGFYLQKKTYDWREAQEALAEGYIVIVVQHKGFWTRGGHYLLLEEVNEEGLVQVRDSNIYNYGRLHGHADDLFSWSTINPAGMGYWIYQNKIVEIPACVRCGEDVSSELFAEDYHCVKCTAAMTRREEYQIFSGDSEAK